MATFAAAVRSLVALRHVDYPKPWDDAAKMESIADAVLESLASEGLIAPDEEMWLAGAFTAEEARASGFPSSPSIRAARIVRLLTDADPAVHQTIRVAITGQTTKERITNKFKLQVAAALIMRSVAGTDERQKVADIYRGMQTGFSDLLASTFWHATYRSTDELVQTALSELKGGGTGGPTTLELAARAAYPLITVRQLLPDRGSRDNDQVDRRVPGAVIERMRADEWGVCWTVALGSKRSPTTGSGDHSRHWVARWRHRHRRRHTSNSYMRWASLALARAAGPPLSPGCQGRPPPPRALSHADPQAPISRGGVAGDRTSGYISSFG